MHSCAELGDMDSSGSQQMRLSAIGIVVFSLFIAVFFRLWFLQGIDRQEFEAASFSNRVRVLHEEGPRGRILDRNGKVLVDNRTSLVVALDREPLRQMKPEERTEIFIDLADSLNELGVPIKLDRIERGYADLRYAPQAHVPIVDDVEEEVEVYLRERAERFPGVIVKRTTTRVYPYGRVAAHILGYVGEINANELERYGPEAEDLDAARTDLGPDGFVGNGEYRLGDSIGKSGVERSFEAVLRGKPGKRTIEVNARGDMVDVIESEPGEAGNDLWLAVDVDLQAHAERLLSTKIHDLRGDYVEDVRRGVTVGLIRVNAPQGSIVIIDPRNGDVLAMASYPDYDPNLLVHGISQNLWAQLNDPNSGQPLLNWALQGAYAPGSTFKLFSAFAGLDSGYLSGGNEVIDDQGTYQVENCTGDSCTFRNAGSTKYYRTDVARSLTVSSDVYYYQLADKFWNLRGQYGETPIQDAAAEFGLGSRTGIRLPGEQGGRLPTPEWMRSMNDQYPDAFPRGQWQTGDSINSSVGQGDVLATPLQLANGYATFANGGTLYRPQVVTKATRANDPAVAPGEPDNYTVVYEAEPEVTGQVNIAPDHYDKIFRGLVGVTQDEGGTATKAWRAEPTTWPFAGKTGTAQVTGKADTALFAGFGPAIPGVPAEYAIAVVIPEAGFGGAVSAPLAFRVMRPVSEGTLIPACHVGDELTCMAAIQSAEDAAAQDVEGSQD